MSYVIETIINWHKTEQWKRDLKIENQLNKNFDHIGNLISVLFVASNLIYFSLCFIEILKLVFFFFFDTNIQIYIEIGK